MTDHAECSYFGCSRRARDGSAYPLHNKKLLQKWIRRTKRDCWSPTTNSYVCGVHFTTDDWTLEDGKKVLKPGAVPQVADTKGYNEKHRSTKEARALRAEKRHCLQTECSQATKKKRSRTDQHLGSDSSLPAVTGEHQICGPTTNMLLHDEPSEPSSAVSVKPDCIVSLISGDVSYPGDFYLGSQQLKIEGINRQAGIAPPTLLAPTSTLDVTPSAATVLEINWRPESDLAETKARWETENSLQKLREANASLQQTSRDYEILKANLSKIYTEEQLAILSRDTDSSKFKPKRWSDTAILKGVQRRFSFGSTGYQEYVNEGHPVPAIRTIQERTEEFKCSPGIDSGTLEILRRRLLTVSCDADKDLILANDEMTLTPGLQYDASTKRVIGNVTLPMHTGTGNKGMTWVVAGIRRRLKQPIAYHITPNSVNGTAIRLVNEELIKAVELQAGGRILAYVTDMAACNLHLWKEYGIDGQRSGEVTFQVTHPADEKRMLVIMPDTPHLGKNMKASLVNNKEFILSDSLVEEFNLPTNKICYSHILEAESYERSDELKLAPKLSKVALNPNNLQQMRVTNTLWVLNDSTAAALEFLAEEKKDPSYLTTAFFCRKFIRWFKLMVAYDRAHALSLHRLDKYQEAQEELKGFMDLIRGIYVKNGWKPWQRGILVATTGYLHLADELLRKGGYLFVLGSRFTTNCVENLYAVLRSRCKVPTVQQWKCGLKSIILTQYSRTVLSSSYDQELSEEFASNCSYLEFFKKAAMTTEACDKFQLPEHWANELPELSLKNENALYYVCGYIIDSVLTNQIHCEECLEGLVTDPFFAPYTKYTMSREFGEGLLTYPSSKAYAWVLAIEKMFIAVTAHLPDVMDTSTLMEDFRDAGLASPEFNKCHDIEDKVFKRFLTFRLKVHCDFVTKREKRIQRAPVSAGSATAAAHQYINNPIAGKSKKK